MAVVLQEDVFVKKMKVGRQMEEIQRKIGVVATSGAVSSAAFEKGVSHLNAMGCEVAVDPSVYAATGYLAGSPQERASVFSAYCGQDLYLIIGARGGFGALELLAHFEENAFSELPLVMGFSDMSAILMRCVALGVEVVHGPTVQSLGHASQHTLAAVKRLILYGEVENPLGGEWSSLCSGWGEGVLAGGNLMTLASMCGTPWQPDFSGCVVALEEVNEAPYRVDRALTQLYLAGCFNGVKGILLGECLNCGEPGAVEAIFRARFEGAHLPVVSGGLFGHGAVNLPMIFGRRVSLSSDDGFSYV